MHAILNRESCIHYYMIKHPADQTPVDMIRCTSVAPIQDMVRCSVHLQFYQYKALFAVVYPLLEQYKTWQRKIFPKLGKASSSLDSCNPITLNIYTSAAGKFLDWA